MAYKMEQILAQFMERKMDLPVLGAKLSFRGAKVCTGSARLFFSSDHFRSNVFGKLWMKAHVHSLRESLKSNDFVLTGRTTDGWKVKVYALQCPYNAAKSEGEDVEIAFTPDLVEFTKSLPYKKPSEDKKFSYGLAYLGPISEFIWTENSTVETTRVWRQIKLPVTTV